MKLRGIEYGRVIGASGVEGFYGMGGEYPHHRLLKPLGILDFKGMGFVAKTMTLDPNAGNLEMNADGITVRRWFPDCIHVSPRSWWNGVALNKVGLTNIGANELLARGLWQRRSEPFMLSFMSMKPTVEERLADLRAFVKLLRSYLPGFAAPFALQINFSCPNVGVHHDADLVREVRAANAIAAELGIPVLDKFDVTVSPYDVCEIGDDEACDGAVISNAMKMGAKGVDWKRLYGFDASPLEKVGKPGTGGGGGSGAFLLPLVEAWIRKVRALGFRRAINGGGGILCPADAERLIRAGADSVFIGSMAFLRPWNVRRTIRHVNRLLEKK